MPDVLAADFVGDRPDTGGARHRVPPEKQVVAGADQAGVEQHRIDIAELAGPDAFGEQAAMEVEQRRDKLTNDIIGDLVAAEIDGDGGKIDKWSLLGIKNTACPGDEITRVSRQNNSGTYTYFREHVLGKTRDYKNGSIDQSGSKDVVALVGKTPCAIGYSGMGYKIDKVNWLKISHKKGEPGIAPGVEVARSGKYPISRKLYLYTAGEPSGEVKAYIDWILSPAGQKIVEKEGFVPLK